jgi:hypothetical protein
MAAGRCLQALLDNRQTDFSADAQKMVERVANRAAEPAIAALPARAAETPRTYPTGTADPRRSAQDFAKLDSAGRRAVMRRLAEDRPEPSACRTPAKRSIRRATMPILPF